jgi:hypothetical protein
VPPSEVRAFQLVGSEDDIPRMGARRLPLLGALIGAALSVSACGVSVTASVQSAPSPVDREYQKVWSADWRAIMTDGAPLVPTETSPGVCNVGGTKNGCYQVGVAMVRDYRRLLLDLRQVSVPAAYRTANSRAREAVATTIKAWVLRCEAIANDDNAAWRQAQSLFVQAHDAISAAYAVFPPTRPLPVPFS